MFYSLSGKIVYTDQTSVAIDCAGVAFRCTVSLNTLKKTGGVGSTATLYTYLSVREDAMELFGFADNDELEFFKLLIGVSGVGPKAAVAILSQLTVRALMLSIVSGDIKAITAAQGVGPKIAQRVVLELKDKVSKMTPSSMSSSQLQGVSVSFGGNMSEAVSALSALGFQQSEAVRVLSALDQTLSVEELIKQALKKLSGGI